MSKINEMQSKLSVYLDQENIMLEKIERYSTRIQELNAVVEVRSSPNFILSVYCVIEPVAGVGEARSSRGDPCRCPQEQYYKSR